MKFTPVTILAVVGAIAGWTCSAVLLKYAAQEWDGEAWQDSERWLGVLFNYLWYFLPANVVGLLFPLCTTIALRNNSPNVVYATIGGPGAVVLFATLGWVFNQPFTPRQWGCVLIIVCGAVLLQIKPAKKPDEAESGQDKPASI